MVNRSPSQRYRTIGHHSMSQTPRQTLSQTINYLSNLPYFNLLTWGSGQCRMHSMTAKQSLQFHATRTQCTKAPEANCASLAYKSQCDRFLNHLLFSNGTLCMHAVSRSTPDKFFVLKFLQCLYLLFIKWRNFRTDLL